MRVLVVGSTLFDSVDISKSDFKDSCRQLGKALAESGHSIVVGSDGENTADRFVVQGANAVTTRKTKVLVSRPEDDRFPDGGSSTPFATERKNGELSNIDFSYRRGRGHWSANRVAQILSSDAVVAVGGAEGTIQTAYSAPLLERPVLTIPSLGGAGKQLWARFEPDYDRVNLRDKIAELRETWIPSHARLAVAILSDLVRRNPYRRNSGRREFVAVIGVALLIAAWVAGFEYPSQHRMITFFLLLIISSLLGSTLRVTLGTLDKEQAPTSPGRIATEFTSGMILAFALALMYFSGGLAITGKFEFVKLLQTDNDFVRVSIAMSLLGLAGSLLIERASERVRHFLEKL